MLAISDLYEIFKIRWNAIPETEKKSVITIRTQKQINKPINKF
jgi:hypothetical protein